MSRLDAIRYLHGKGARIWSAPPECRRLGRCKEEDRMRKFLLASVATLGTAGLTGAAFAQAPGAPIPQNPVQGGFVTAPLASPPVGANNNNNRQAPALPGPAANPTPGTIVVHFNGFVVSEFEAGFTSTDSRIAAPVTYNQASTSPQAPPTSLWATSPAARSS